MDWIFTLKNGDSYNTNTLNVSENIKVGYNQTSIRTEVSKYTTRAGGLEVGKRRENVGSIDIEYTSHDHNKEVLADINKLYKWCKFVDYLTNEDGLKMYLVPKTPKTNSPIGARGKLATFTCSFSTLKPYWQGNAITQTETLSGSAVNRFDVECEGTAEILPVFNLLVPNAQTLNTLVITNTYNSESIQLLTAGVVGDGVTELSIDCENGTVTFGALDVLSKVTPGTGFLEFAPFTNSLEVTTNIDIDMDIVYTEGVYFG